MAQIIYTQALFIIADSGYLRGVVVVLAFVRTFLNRRRFVRFRMGWVEVLCTVEPLLLLAVTYLVQTTTAPAVTVTFGQLSVAVLGAVMALAGWTLLAWSFLSWRSLFAGHGVLLDHKLVTRGAYGFVRHPVYLAALLIWLSLAVGFQSTTTLLVTILYVIPIYVLYIRSEEEMMLESFGAAYRDYRRDTPMLVPRLLRAKPAPRPVP
jgi:protein-S-isoprenylcysteine O-methyltransferase Ste14